MTIRKSIQTERIINLDGPDGNAFVLINIASNWARQIEGYNCVEIVGEMKSGDYTNLVKTFDRYFGTLCVLETENEELLKELEND